MSETSEHRQTDTPDDIGAGGITAPAAEFMEDRQKPPVLIWIGLSFLVIVALAVVFVLPEIVNDYELPLERRVNVAPQPLATQSSAPAGEAISPFEQAQQAQQRKEAQDVLAELLAKQSELDLLEVSQWNLPEYEAALANAREGDEAYRNQEFAAARDLYQAGDVALAELLASVPQVLEDLLRQGAQAIESDNGPLAVERYSLALVLDAQNIEAQQGFGRAESLEEVSSLMRQAEELVDDGELESAREVYSQIVSLDPLHETASGLLAQTQASILQAEFSGIMSEGFRLLEQENPMLAIEAFNRALAMGINTDQAQAAIEQTETQVASAKIVDLQEAVQIAEAAENWEAAVDAYSQVLAIDPNLVFAIQGRDYAGKRLQLDKLLESAIANPLRLGDAAVYEQVRDIYFTGETIENPGARLQGQLASLKPLLDSSQIAESVDLISDSFTEVSLLRVGNLGKFETQNLSLMPGEYVVIGKRTGYREVRHEFVVGFGQTPPQIVVQCEERVGPASRR